MQMVDLSVALDQDDGLTGLLDLDTDRMSCELVRVAAQGTRQLPPSPNRERLLLALGGSATLIASESRKTLVSGLLVAVTQGSGLELQCEGTEPFEALLITSSSASETS
jgi:hypothetical protein